MGTIYKIIKIDGKEITIQDQNDNLMRSDKIIVPDFAKEGDLICRIEHYFFKVIDKDGNIIPRMNT